MSKKLTTEEKIAKLQARLDKWSDKRERNINRYIIPVEIQMSRLEDEIDLLKGKRPLGGI